MSNVRLKNLGRALGMEDDGEMPGKGVELEVAEDGAPIKGDETVEAEELAVDEASDEVAEEMDAGDDLVEAEQTLESIYAALRDASETGRGISQESAQFMTIAIEGIRIRGKHLTAPAVGVPSCESFGSSNRAMSNTNLSMEGIGDVLRKVWEWIKTQVNKIVAKIKTWYKNVLGMAPRLKKRAEAIKKKADGTSGSTDETTIEISTHKALVTEKKVPSASEAKQQLSLIAEVAKKVLATGGPVGYDLADKLIEELNSLDTKSTPNGDSIATSLEKIGEKIGTQFITSPGKVESERFDKDSEVDAMAPTFGNKQFFSVVKKMTDKSPEGVKRMISGMKIGYDNQYKKTPDTDSSADYKVMTLGEVSDICDGVIDICDYVIDYEKKWQDREKYGKKIQDAAQKASNRFDKDKEVAGDLSRALKSYAMSVYAVWAMGIRTETNVTGYSLGTSRALLTWCERSLSTYK